MAPSADMSRQSSHTVLNHSSHEKATEEPQAGRQYSYSFFSPALKSMRADYFKAMIGVSVITVVAVLAILPIYWGALWKTQDLSSGLHGWVVDLDGGVIGQEITQAFAAASGQKGQLTWESKSGSDFQNGLEDIANGITENQAWAAVIINAGASEALSDAQATANTAYEPTSAITVYTNPARNEQGYGSFISPSLARVLPQACRNFAATQAGQVTDAAALAATAPQVLTSPVWYEEIQLRPYDVPVATAVTFVGSIYLLIISFIVVMAGNGARMQLANKLKLKDLILLRLATAFVLYFFLSLFFALVSLAFQVPFSRVFGSAGFVIYWMLCYCGMLTLGLALEAMITLLTPRFITFFLMLWIISNVSVALTPLEVENRLYQYGHAMPFYNISNAVRAIIFDTRNELGQNFGILIAWIAVSCITIPLFTWMVTRKSRKEAAHTRTEQQDQKI